MGAPALINAKEPPHTEAMDEDPFDSVISETIRTVYGKSSYSGRISLMARSAKFPWPISLRLVKPMRPVSPTQ